MRHLWLADTLRAAGLPVVEVAGWQTRGREMLRTTGVIGHHTASARTSGECPSLRIVIAGRPDLPGPLAQLLLGRSGAWYVVASGKANHAGIGGYHGIAAAVSNANLLGIEAENDGVGEPWPMRQLSSYTIGVAALLHHEGLPYSAFASHYEWALPRGRKIDPAGTWTGGGDWYSGGQWTGTVKTATATDFRARVKARLDSWGDDLNDEQDKLLRQAAADAAYNRHLLDDVIRPKLDAVYVEVADETEDGTNVTLGGNVKAIRTTVGA